MTKLPFLPEHLEEGIVVKAISVRPCTYCHTSTQMFDPYTKAYVCSLSCYNRVQEVIDNARQNNGLS
jgi:hypothetical protein